VSVAINLAATALFLGLLGAGGLALATSIASICNFTLLILFLRPHIGGFEGRRFAVSLAKVGAGCAALALVTLVAWPLLAGPGPVRLDLRHYAALVLTLLLAGGAFMAVQFALRSEEAGVALRVFLRRKNAVEAVA
jgi:putative peptidoglycan lipid II flippase